MTTYIAETFNKENYKDEFKTRCHTIKNILNIDDYELTDVIESFASDDLFFDEEYEELDYSNYQLVYFLNKEQLLAILDEVDETRFGNDDFRIMKKDLNHYRYIMDKLNVLKK